MLYHSSLIVAAYTVLAVASPVAIEQTTTCPKVQRNANFDDLKPAVPGVPLDKVKIGYIGLLFQAFDLAGTVSLNNPSIPGMPDLPDLPLPTLPQPGLAPHSIPNYASVNLNSMLTGGTPMLTVNFPMSNTESFSLDSFYFGCVTRTGTAVAALPAECLVTVTGYRGSDNSVSNAQQVCSQQFQYNPSTATGTQQLAFSDSVTGRNDCKDKDIQFSIVTFDPPGGLAATKPLMGLVVDDVKFSTKAISC